MSGLSLYDKVWQAHVVREADGQALLYIDRHLIHEVTSPQPFDGLRLAGRKPWRVDAVQAVPDHNVPTLHPEREIEDAVSRAQVEALERNCAEFGIRLFGRRDPRQGIVHVVGPEQGLTLPGMTVVCGDSHTSTHGAFAALAFGIGTSEVEHVLATQCLPQKKTKSMRIVIDGALQPGVFAKDLMLAVIRTIGTAGGTGYTLEFAGSAIRALSMEGRMTMCNMSIEAGARAGLVAVDETTLAYLRGRPSAPQGALWDAAEAYWRTLVSDEDARFDAEVVLDAAAIAPQVSWGTSPEMVVDVGGVVPHLADARDDNQRNAYARALDYMGLHEGQAVGDIALDAVFIGSCTNARIEDLRVGFEWRGPGCSMCLAMNADRIPAGKRCASTSNRNFEGRQGQGARTHLVSPAMAAAAAVAGRFVDVREWLA